MVVLGFNLYWALSLYAFPGSFSLSTYDGIRPYLPWLSASFLAGALALILLIRYQIPHVGRILAACVGAAPLLFVAAYAISVSSWLGALNYAAMGLALLPLPWFPAGGERREGRTRYVYPAVLGMILLGTALLAWLVPSSLGTPETTFIRPNRLLVIGSGLAGAVALLLPHDEGRVSLWRAVSAAVLPAFLGYGFLRGGAYSGGVWLIHAVGVLVVSRPLFVERRPFPVLGAEAKADPLDAGDQHVELTTWLLVAAVVFLRPVEGEAAHTGPESILFVLLMSGLNLLRWLFPSRLSQARQLLWHLSGVATATGLFLIGLGHGDALFAPVLILLPILAARSLGQQAAGQVLAAGVGALLIGSLLASYQMQKLYPFGEGVVTGTVVTAISLIAIRSVVQQRRQLKELEMMSRVSGAVRQSLDLAPLLQATVDELGRTLETSRCHVWLIDSEGVCTAEAEYAAPGVRPIGVGFRLHLSTIFLSEHAHGVVQVADIDAHPLLGGPGEALRKSLHQTGVRSFMAATIRFDGDLIAAVTFHQCDGLRAWQREEADFLDAISGQIGLAIAHADTHAKLVTSYQDLQAHGEELIAQQEELAAQNEQLTTKSQELEEAQEKLSNLVDNLAGLVYRYVWRGNWQLEFLAGTSLELTGYHLNELPKGAFLSLSLAEDRLSGEAELARAVAERRPYAFEYRIRTREGQIRWLLTRGRALYDQQGAPRAVEGIVTDITDRKLAEESLAQVSRENRLLLTSAGEGICGLDSAGKLTFVNPAALRMLGQQASDLLGQPIATMLHPATKPGWDECPVGKTLREARPHSGQALLQRRDGTTFPAEFVCTPKGEQAEGAVVIFRDIAERQAVERMKNEFISVVSHELRTPLTSIRGSLGLLNSGKLGSLPEKGQRMLQIAMQNTDRLVRLINDILDIERIESGKVTIHKANCDVAHLVAQAIEVTQPVADKVGVRLETRVDSTPLRADPDRIIQALTNLIGNAIKFSEPGQAVRIDARAAGGEIHFVVQDQGRGIPAGKLESIFERFQQVDASDSRKKGGTGLGLAICRSIVQEHGGRIWAESEAGQGSSFHFTLPLHGEAPLATPSLPATDQHGGRSSSPRGG